MIRKLGLILFGSLLVFGLVACDEAEINKVDNAEQTEASGTVEENDNNKTEDNNEPEEAEEDADEELLVGDTVNFDGLEITLNEARDEEGGEFDEPSEDLFVVANLTIENTTDESQTVSSLMNIELKDSEGYSYTTTILMEGTKGQLDGEIEPGGTLRGEIPFDVAESDTYELHFSDPFKSGKAIWTITELD